MNNQMMCAKPAAHFRVFLKAHAHLPGFAAT